MTQKPLTKPTIMIIPLKFLPILVAATLSSLIPSLALASHLFRRAGTISLENGYHVDIMTEKAADWGQTIFTLYKDGDPHPIFTQQAPTYAANVEEGVLYKIDLNNNKKQEYLIIDSGRSTTAPITTQKQQRSWPDKNPKITSGEFCGYINSIVISDDMTRMDYFSYSDIGTPLASSSFQVMGPDRARAIIGGKTENVLSVTSGFSSNMWNALVHYFNPLCMQSKDKSNLALQFPISPRQVPLNYLKWQDYLPNLLEMYTNAKQAYQDAIREGGPDYRTKALGVFRFTPFFSIFPFDAVDPGNKEPRYTALLNDYAFYLYNFYLEFINRHKEENKSIEGSSSLIELRESVIPILLHVLKRDPTRTVAWLNLADAQWEVTELHAESANTYRRYLDLLHRSAPHSKPPKRALQRAK